MCPTNSKASFTLNASNFIHLLHTGGEYYDESILDKAGKSDIDEVLYEDTANMTPEPAAPERPVMAVAPLPKTPKAPSPVHSDGEDDEDLYDEGTTQDPGQFTLIYTVLL